MDRYTVYGDLSARDTLALTTTLVAKGLRVEFVPQTASLSFALASRAGSLSGPYLRTPEGFVLSDLHAMLDWIERMHPEPRLLPVLTMTPVRWVCARLLEDWIELWLPLWPRRSWTTLEGIGAHLEVAGFLLGSEPSRPDWLLAAWLETEVLVHEHARAHLAQCAPRLVSLGNDLLEWSSARPADRPEASDDVVPISLLVLLEEIATDYHAYLVGNQRALKDRTDRVMLDLGFGRRALPVRSRCEERRVEIGQELGGLGRLERQDIRRVLEPVGAWHALTLPSVLSETDPSDPRSL
jgi:glutathione S-transferase